MVTEIATIDTPSDARDRLIVALDVATVDEARELVAGFGDSVCFYKIGLELVMQGGLSLVRELKDAGHNVFLDVKLLDIPNTVCKATANAARSGADLLTVHATDTRTVEAAAEGAAGTRLKVLGVTVLTSVNDDDLREQQVASSPKDLVLHRSKLAIAAGAHGLIASGQEAAAIRQVVGQEPLLVTPGIRLPSSAAGDQARITTPEQAIADGASHIVVGRPIVQAADPRAAADDFARRIAAAAN